MAETHEIKNVFLDTDVILDFIMKREPFHLASGSIFEMAKHDEVRLNVSASCFTNIFYIFRKIAGNEKAKHAISSLLIFINVLEVNSYIVKTAVESPFNDFEDAVQYFTATNNQIDILITRNISDYILDDIPVMTPDEFLKTI